MGAQINFIDKLYPRIHFELIGADVVFQRYNISAREVLNLCGGVPALYISHIHVTISGTYSSALSVKVITDQYEVVRNMDFEIGRIDNNYMYVQEKGQGIGTNLFLNQLQAAWKCQIKKLITISMAPDDERAWDGYYFWANLGFENTDIEEYQEWAAVMGREESTLSELMQTKEGRDLWKRSGFTWIGSFHLARGHSCWDYLQRHIKRKGIDFDLDGQVFYQAA